MYGFYWATPYMGFNTQHSAADTWTPLATNIKALETFHMKCQRQLLQISWQQFI